VLPPTLAENVEAVTRRYWALDQTMLNASVKRWAYIADAPIMLHRLSLQGWKMVLREPEDLGAPLVKAVVYHPTKGYAEAIGSLREFQAPGAPYNPYDDLKSSVMLSALQGAWEMVR
jgi:hypothetical protein